jgi:hypothetical protein
MKDFSSLATFAIVPLCFVVFVTTVKPDAISAVSASSKPEYCKMQASGGVQGCREHVFAAASGVEGRAR